jgi:hypothetical protein
MDNCDLCWSWIEDNMFVTYPCGHNAHLKCHNEGIIPKAPPLCRSCRFWNRKPHEERICDCCYIKISPLDVAKTLPCGCQQHLSCLRNWFEERKLMYGVFFCLYTYSTCFFDPSYSTVYSSLTHENDVRVRKVRRYCDTTRART